MKLEENKAVVRRPFDLIQRGDLDELDEVHTPDFANHALGKVQVGLETFKAVLRGIPNTFPDETTTIEDMIAEGDRVVVRSTLRGTHQGSALPLFAGIKPEGTSVVWDLIHIFRLRGQDCGALGPAERPGGSPAFAGAARWCGLTLPAADCAPRGPNGSPSIGPV